MRAVTCNDREQQHMEIEGGQIVVERFLVTTIAIVVFFAGMHLNRRVRLLSDYNIPEPVTGGLLAAVIIFVLYQITGLEVVFDLQTRDVLLVYFFTCIGLNARLSDLITEV